MGDSPIFTVSFFSQNLLDLWFVVLVACDLPVFFSVPVFERRVDNIVGIAYAMDMLDYVEQVLNPALHFMILNSRARIQLPYSCSILKIVAG